MPWSEPIVVAVFTKSKVDLPGGSLRKAGGGAMAWAVIAPTVGPPRGGLAGSYVGASGSATAGVGVGANVLFSGSGRSFALQPLSLQGQAGLDLTLGVSGLELRWLPP